LKIWPTVRHPGGPGQKLASAGPIDWAADNPIRLMIIDEYHSFSLFIPATRQFLIFPIFAPVDLPSFT
jgi:hypothetical protein